MSTTPPSTSHYPWKIQFSIYSVGLFSTAIYYTSMILVPLQAFSLGASPLLLGIIFAARHFLPLFLSIHAGALMDRLGVGRVILAVSAIGVVVPLLYPVAPWAWTLILLQVFAGLTDILGWMGAQTLVGHHLDGKTTYSGRLMAVARTGPFIAPAVAGFAWQYVGPWGGFGILSLLAVFLALAVMALPKSAHRRATDGSKGRGIRQKIDVLIPRFSDYQAAFRLLTRPIVVFVVLLGSVYHLIGAIQGTFYIQWLTEIGVSGAEIGSIVSMGAAAAAAGSLLTGRLRRHIPGPWILLLASWTAVVLICLTPIFVSLTAIAAVMVARMWFLGLSQPLTVSLLLRSVSESERGLSVGVRGTVNRIASIVSPIIMGFAAELFGIELSFYISGILLSSMFLLMVLYYWRHSDILSV